MVIGGGPGVRQGVDRLRRVGHNVGTRSTAPMVRPHRTAGRSTGPRTPLCRPRKRKQTRGTRDGIVNVNLEEDRRPVQQAVAAAERLCGSLERGRCRDAAGWRPRLLATVIRSRVRSAFTAERQNVGQRTAWPKGFDGGRSGGWGWRIGAGPGERYGVDRLRRVGHNVGARSPTRWGELIERWGDRRDLEDRFVGRETEADPGARVMGS